MEINIFADTICGWCYIGHKNLNTAIKKFPNIKFEIKHIPFQLNPDMPIGGITRDKYLEIKFGGKKFAEPMYENMKLKAKESGMNFNLDKIKKTPNTVLSHLLIILSEKFNIQNQVKEKIYRSYFIDGLDIGDIHVLTEIAKQHNISEEIFKNFINNLIKLSQSYKFSHISTVQIHGDPQRSYLLKTCMCNLQYLCQPCLINSR